MCTFAFGSVPAKVSTVLPALSVEKEDTFTLSLVISLLRIQGAMVGEVDAYSKQKSQLKGHAAFTRRPLFWFRQYLLFLFDCAPIQRHPFLVLRLVVIL